MRNAVLEREVLRRSAHVYDEKIVEVDESVMKLLVNRDRYIAQSEATRNRLPAHPPVPASKALVPVQS